LRFADVGSTAGVIGSIVGSTGLRIGSNRRVGVKIGEIYLVAGVVIGIKNSGSLKIKSL
jgi:hypothetical protein